MRDPERPSPEAQAAQRAEGIRKLTFTRVRLLSRRIWSLTASVRLRATPRAAGRGPGGFVSTLKSWALSGLLHGSILALAVFLADRVHLGRGRIPGGSPERGAWTDPAAATLRAPEDPRLGGERIPDSPQYGPLADLAGLPDPRAELPPVPELPLDVRELDSRNLSRPRVEKPLSGELPGRPLPGGVRTQIFPGVKQPLAEAWMGGPGVLGRRGKHEKPGAHPDARGPVPGAGPRVGKPGTGIVASLARSPAALLARLSGAPGPLRSMIGSWTRSLPTAVQAWVRGWPGTPRGLGTLGRNGALRLGAPTGFSPARLPAFGSDIAGPRPGGERSSIRGTETRTVHSLQNGTINGSAMGPRLGASSMSGTDFRGRP